MNDLTLSFNDSLLLNTSDILKDYAELGIDSVLDAGVLKDIPIISTIFGVSKVINSVHERNLIKNLLLFLNELNSGNIDKEKLTNYKARLNSNKKEAEKELGRVLIILNQIIDNDKSIMLGKIFKAYVNEKIDWNQFCEFSEIVNRLFLQDVDALKQIYYGRLKETSGMGDMYRIERLNSLGIIGLSTKTMMIGSNSNSRTDSYIVLNRMGGILTNIIFN
jgi:hypothetical protein